MAKHSPDTSVLSVLRPITSFPDVLFEVKDIETYDPARDGVPSHIVTDEIARLQNELNSPNLSLAASDTRPYESIKLLKTLQSRNPIMISCDEYEHMIQLRKGSALDYCGGVYWYIVGKVGEFSGLRGEEPCLLPRRRNIQGGPSWHCGREPGKNKMGRRI